MNWLNIHTDILRSEKYLGAEPVERATWLSLMGWCATQENGGTIKGARQWKDRKWQQVCGITKSEVELVSELYEFADDDLAVHFYPIDKELEVSAKREAGKKGGRPKKSTLKSNNKPCGLTENNHVVKESKREAVTEGKGMEGKGKGKRSKPAPEIFALPFESDNFKESWEEWISYLKERRKAPTKTTIKKQLKQLEKTNEKEAIESIEESIKNGWQGLFPKSRGETKKLGDKYIGKPRQNDSRSTRNNANSGVGIDVPLL